MKIDSFTGKYRFLSNFWLCDIRYEDIEYPSTEHAYQAAKTLDLNVRRDIAKLDKTPGAAKRHGRYVELRPDWEEVKIGIMRQLNQQKFSRHKDLAELLIATGDTELVEGNTWNDTFWGVCNGVGENWLGKILMEIRKDLKNLVDET